MIKRAIAGGLAGLGLIGGTASVVYNNNGGATVKIKDDKTGQVQSVTIGGAGGQSFSCPSGTRHKLEPHDIEAARIKLTLQQVRREEKAIERKYSSGRAPGRVVDHYKALNRRDARLVTAFNAEVDAHNTIIDQDCKPAS